MMLEIQTEPVPGLQGCQQRHEGSEPSPTHDGQACMRKHPARGKNSDSGALSRKSLLEVRSGEVEGWVRKGF